MKTRKTQILTTSMDLKISARRVWIIIIPVILTTTRKRSKNVIAAADTGLKNPNMADSKGTGTEVRDRAVVDAAVPKAMDRAVVGAECKMISAGIDISTVMNKRKVQLSEDNSL